MFDQHVSELIHRLVNLIEERVVGLGLGCVSAVIFRLIPCAL
jgi:hypothetical protein